MDVKSTWEYLHSVFGVREEADRIRERFMRGDIDYAEWMRLDTELWIRARGGRLHRRELERALARVRIVEEAFDLFQYLRDKGFMTVLVSGGVDILVGRVARELGADEWYANELLFDDSGYLIPGGNPVVGVWKDKVVKEVAERTGARLDSSIFVGDSEWDLPAFEVVGVPIAYRSNDFVGRRAKYSVDSLRGIIGIVKYVLG